MKVIAIPAASALALDCASALRRCWLSLHITVGLYFLAHGFHRHSLSISSAGIEADTLITAPPISAVSRPSEALESALGVRSMKRGRSPAALPASLAHADIDWGDAAISADSFRGEIPPPRHLLEAFA